MKAEFNIKLSSILKDNDRVSKEKRLSFMKYTGEVLLERTFVEGINKESLKDVNSFISLDSLSPSTFLSCCKTLVTGSNSRFFRSAIIFRATSQISFSKNLFSFWVRQLVDCYCSICPSLSSP